MGRESLGDSLDPWCTLVPGDFRSRDPNCCSFHRIILQEKNKDGSHTILFRKKIHTMLIHSVWNQSLLSGLNLYRVAVRARKNEEGRAEFIFVQFESVKPQKEERCLSICDFWAVYDFCSRRRIFFVILEYLVDVFWVCV